MKGLYPQRLGYLYSTDILILEHELTMADIAWSGPQASDAMGTANSTEAQGNQFNNLTNILGMDTANTRVRRGSGTVVQTDVYGNGTYQYEHVIQGHSLEEDIAHALHKASITILGILVIEVINTL